MLKMQCAPEEMREKVASAWRTGKADQTSVQKVETCIAKKRTCVEFKGIVLNNLRW